MFLNLHHTVAAAAAFLIAFIASGSPAHASNADDPAPALKAGDPAPPLKVGKWIKGQPVQGFQKGKVYVVEFWATWCHPCVEMIPHLTAAQKDYPGVVFIGQNVCEADDSKLEDFVQKMGGKMDYRVATDNKSVIPQGEMWTSWMVAARLLGIPSSFIVGQDGTILWIGHPMELERVLDAVVAGTFDAKAEASYQADLAAKISAPADKGDWNAALASLGGLIADYPQYKAQLQNYKIGLSFAASKSDEAYATMDQQFELFRNDAAKLNRLVNDLLTKPSYMPRDLDRALKYAGRAKDVSEGRDGSILSTLARVYDAKGDVVKAIELQSQAVNVAGPDSSEAEDLKKTLAEYETRRPK